MNLLLERNRFDEPFFSSTAHHTRVVSAGGSKTQRRATRYYALASCSSKRLSAMRMPTWLLMHCSRQSVSVAETQEQHSRRTAHLQRDRAMCFKTQQASANQPSKYLLQSGRLGRQELSASTEATQASMSVPPNQRKQHSEKAARLRRRQQTRGVEYRALMEVDERPQRVQILVQLHTVMHAHNARTRGKAIESGFQHKERASSTLQATTGTLHAHQMTQHGPRQAQLELG